MARFPLLVAIAVLGATGCKTMRCYPQVPRLFMREAAYAAPVAPPAGPSVPLPPPPLEAAPSPPNGAALRDPEVERAAGEQAPNSAGTVASSDHPVPLPSPGRGDLDPSAPASAAVEDTPRSSAPDRASEPMPAITDANPPAVAGAEPLTLNHVIREVIESDPQLLAGMEAINQANADLVTASTAPNPHLAVNQSLMPLTRPFTVTRQGGPPQLDVLLNYPIDWYLFGKQAAAVTSAQWGLDISATEFADLVRQRVDAAIQAYYDVLEAARLVELAEQELASRTRLEQIARDRLQASDIAAIELDRIRISSIDAAQALQDQQAKLEQAKAKLNALMGREQPGGQLNLAATLEVSQPPAAPSFEQSWAIAQENRPDIAALHKKIHKAEADIAKEQANAKPTVTPMIGYTRQFQEKAIGFPDANSYDFGLGMTLPVFDRNQGMIEKSVSTLNQRRQEYQAKLLQVRSEIQQATAEYRAALTAVTRLRQEQLLAGREVRDKTEVAYRAGEKSLVDVLDAQTAYRNLYQLYIQGQSRYWHALHKLNAVLGIQYLK